MVIPQPKALQLAEGRFLLQPGAAWSVTGPREARKVMAALRSILRSHSPALKASGALHVHGEEWTVVRLGFPGHAPPSSGRAVPSETSPDAEWAANPEGYRLEVGSAGIEIAAPTPRGAFYGIQTLAQLLQDSEGGVGCRWVIIEDWPTLPFRGAHWFPSAPGVPFQRKLIERVMARYKLNTAVIQCEGARWERHPEIAAPESISMRDLRGLVDLCRRNFIEPVPLVNIPGHADWMFRNGRNLELAEDRDTPYAYCVNQPEAEAFVQDVLREALDLFRPAYFHLGHDEVTLRGRFPHPDCPRCRGRDVTSLVVEHARRYDAWLRARNVRMIIWGDMLLAREEKTGDAHAPNAIEAQARRAGLPPGTLVADWHYDSRAHYPSLDLLRQAGLDTVACTWYEPLNIYRFSQAMIRSREAGGAASASHPDGRGGLLQTTWAGHFPDERVLQGVERRQFSAFVLAAEYAWSGRQDPPAALPYRPDVEFTRAYSTGTGR